jgi:hypothetical protein
VIVAANGGTDRWGGRLPQMVEIDGEPILHRTLRQVAEFTDDVWVCGPDELRPLGGAVLVRPESTGGLGWIDCYWSTRHLWSPESRTVHLLGDVWFSSASIDTIMGDRDRGWRLYARFGPSHHSSKPYGEVWGHSFYPEHQAEHLSAILRVMDAYQSGLIDRSSPWEHYAAMEGAEDLTECIPRGRYISIDDRTEDFDYPVYLERWLESRP